FQRTERTSPRFSTPARCSMDETDVGVDMNTLPVKLRDKDNTHQAVRVCEGAGTSCSLPITRKYTCSRLCGTSLSVTTAAPCSARRRSTCGFVVMGSGVR